MTQKMSISFTCLCLIWNNLSAQRNIIDSLKKAAVGVTDIRKKIDLNNEISFAYNVVKPDTAWTIAEKTYLEAKKNNYIKGMARAAYCKGSAAFYVGNYDLDIQNTLECLRLYESIQDKAGMSAALSGLGISYDYQGQYEISMKCLTRATRLARESGNPRALGVSLGNLANVYTKQGRTKEALRLALEAESVLAKFNDLRAYAYSLNAVSQVYLKNKEYEKALAYNAKNRAVCKQSAEFDTYISALLIEGKIHKQLKDYAESERNFLEAARIAQRMRYRAKHKDISMELANLFLAVGDYKQAASYFQRYALIKDTLLTEANTKNIAQMQNKYDLEKKENENKLLRKQQQLNKVLLRQQFWTIVSIGVFLASLVIISIILYRRQSEKENNNALLRRQNSEIQTHKSELETQAIALKELNTTKDKLFAIIGHDLRSPINSLQGLMNLLNDNNISPQEFMTFIGKFKNSVEHVSFTLNNLLLWANSQLQGLQTRPRVINLYQLATENLNFLGEIAKNKNIELHNQLSEDISAWADKDQINLIFRNLISNALKFTPNHGQVFISGKDKGEFTEVVVSDTGIGIGAESIEKLFKKESHFTTYGTSGEKGTGLGLLLCQEMAEKNNGKIWLESDLGKGTTFKFILPAYLQSPA